jgi:hypothetical protein
MLKFIRHGKMIKIVLAAGLLFSAWLVAGHYHAHDHGGPFSESHHCPICLTAAVFSSSDHILPPTTIIQPLFSLFGVLFTVLSFFNSFFCIDLPVAHSPPLN